MTAATVERPKRRRSMKVKPCGYSCGCRIDPADPLALRTISYGGGVQSTALLALAAAGQINFRTFLFSNVGDDSEHPDTLKYVEHIAKPFATAHGLTMHELQRIKRDGSIETLWGRLMKEESRSLPIPVRMSNGAPGNRSCTSDFKIKVIARWLKAHGAHEDNPATIGIGISLDEIQRANARKVEPHERITYPLVGIGEETGLKMRRTDCERFIRETPLPESVAAYLREHADDIPASSRAQLEASGYTTLPIPPKSSCFFCPFHRPTAWADLARETPDLFEKSCHLEDTLNDRRRMLGKDEVFLTRFAVPLSRAIDTDADLLPIFDPADASCDSGYCWT